MPTLLVSSACSNVSLLPYQLTLIYYYTIKLCPSLSHPCLCSHCFLYHFSSSFNTILSFFSTFYLPYTSTSVIFLPLYTTNLLFILPHFYTFFSLSSSLSLPILYFFPSLLCSLLPFVFSYVLPSLYICIYIYSPLHSLFTFHSSFHQYCFLLFSLPCLI